VDPKVPAQRFKPMQSWCGPDLTAWQLVHHQVVILLYSVLFRPNCLAPPSGSGCGKGPRNENQVNLPPDIRFGFLFFNSLSAHSLCSSNGDTHSSSNS